MGSSAALGTDSVAIDQRQRSFGDQAATVAIVALLHRGDGTKRIMSTSCGLAHVRWMVHWGAVALVCVAMVGAASESHLPPEWRLPENVELVSTTTSTPKQYTGDPALDFLQEQGADSLGSTRFDLNKMIEESKESMKQTWLKLRRQKYAFSKKLTDARALFKRERAKLRLNFKKCRYFIKTTKSVQDEACTKFIPCEDNNTCPKEENKSEEGTKESREESCEGGKESCEEEGKESREESCEEAEEEEERATSSSGNQKERKESCKEGSESREENCKEGSESREENCKEGKESREEGPEIRQEKREREQTGIEEIQSAQSAYGPAETSQGI